MNHLLNEAMKLELIVLNSNKDAVRAIQQHFGMHYLIRQSNKYIPYTF